MRFFIGLNNAKLEKKWNVSPELFFFREIQAEAGIPAKARCQSPPFSLCCDESYNISEG
jgi:hypothetical protein